VERGVEMKERKQFQNRINTSNNKGFTLIEIIAVIIIMGVLIVVSGIAVTGYIENSKAKTYESYKKDLAGASDNYLINCMTNNENNCSIPEYGNDLRITYNELVEKGYSEKLKDPEGDGYCDKSYVIAKNTSKDGVDIEYQVCLYCSKYESTDDGCEEITIDDVTPPTCGESKGESTTWSKENKVITVKCTDSGIGCKKNEFSKSIGKAGEVITEGVVTIEDKAGNKTNCPVTAYVDRKAPTCKIELNATDVNGWYKTGVTASITNISDEGSGVAESGMGTSLVNRSYNGKTSYVVTGGIVTVFGYVKDNVGNEGYCSKEVKVDNTDPTGIIYMGYEVYPKENSTKSGNTLTINNISKYGDIDGVIIYFSESLASNIRSDVKDGNGKSIKTSGGLTEKSGKGILKISKGTYDKLQIYIGDSTYTSKIEKVEVIKNENVTSVWTNKDVSVYVDAKDTITGVGSYSYDNGSSYITSNIKSYSSNTSNTVIIKDKVGNASDKYTFTINKIDKLAPQLKVDAYICSDPSSGEACASSAHTKKDSSSTNGATVTIDWTNKGGYFEYDVTETNFENVEWKYNDTGSVKETALITTKTYESEKSYVTLWGAGYRVGKLTAYDKAGNSTSINVVIKIDRISPTCTLTASGTKGSNDWYTDDVTISFRTHADTGGSGVDDYGIGSISGNTTAKLTTDNSSKTYTGYIKDKAGNENTCTVTIKRDATNPQLKVDAYICSDPSSGEACASSTHTYKDSSSTNGATVTIDWTNKGGYFAYAVTETNFENVKWEYNKHGSTTNKDLVNSSNKTEQSSYVTLTGAGYRVGKLTAYDKAGNSASINVVIKIDRENPTCTLTASGTKGSNDWYTDDVTISFRTHADTGGSGVDDYGIGSISGNTTAKLTTDNSSRTYTGYIKDKAGNENTCTITVKRDATKPQLKVDAYTCSDPSDSDACRKSKLSTSSGSSDTNGSTVTIDWTNKGGYFAYDVTETNFENVKWEYNDSGNTAETAVSNESSKDNKNDVVTLTAAGYRVGKITAYDKAGNSTSINVVIKIDKISPTCTLTASGTKGSNDWYTDDVTISFKTYADTGGSGIDTYGIGGYTSSQTATLTTDTDSTGQEYTGYIKDKAGNTNTCEITVKRRNTPTVTITGNAGKWMCSDYWLGDECREGKAPSKTSCTYCTDSSGNDKKYSNIIGKVDYTIDSNTVTFTWEFQQGNAWLGDHDTHWIDFIIKDSGGKEVHKDRIRKAWGDDKWDIYSKHTGTVIYTFDTKGTYYIYTESGTKEVVFNMSLATITVS